MAADEVKAMTQEEHKKLQEKGEKLRRRYLYYLDRIENAPRDARAPDYKIGLLREISADKLLPPAVKTKLKKKAISIEVDKRQQHRSAKFDFDKVPGVGNPYKGSHDVIQRMKDRSAQRRATTL